MDWGAGLSAGSATKVAALGENGWMLASVARGMGFSAGVRNSSKVKTPMSSVATAEPTANTASFGRRLSPGRVSGRLVVATRASSERGTDDAGDAGWAALVDPPPKFEWRLAGAGVPLRPRSSGPFVDAIPPAAAAALAALRLASARSNTAS